VDFNLLGMSMMRSPDGSLFLSLPKLEDEIVAELNPGEELAASPYRRLHETGAGNALSGAERSSYRRWVAKLLYLVTHTRPELRFAVGMLTTQQVAPTTEHWADMIQIAKYLYANQHMGLRISPSDLQLRVSADASYLLHEDSRGQSGVVAWFGSQNAPIYVGSNKQTLVVTSSMEGEALALASAGRITNTLLALCEDLECFQHEPPQVEQDNQSLMKLLQRDAVAGSSKHVVMRLNFIKDQMERKSLGTKYVPSEEILADALTKPFVGIGFERWRNRFLNTASPDSLVALALVRRLRG
jgi:hypothetical protein